MRFLLNKVLNETGLEGWKVCSDPGLRYQDKLFVPTNCCDEVLKEFNNSNFAIHPGGNKMYQDLKW